MIWNPQVAVSALPVALMFDNFNAPNETALDGRTPPVRAIANDWAVPQGVYTINGNRVEARFPSGGQAVATFDVGLADVELQTTLIFPPNGSGRTGGFTFRYSANADRWSTTANADLNVYRIIETTGGSSTIRAESEFNFVPGVLYRLRLLLQGDKITTTIDGVGSITYTSSVGNDRTRHGLRANNTVGSDPIAFEDFIILSPPSISDVTATVDASSFTTSQLRTGMTIVDNNLMFSGAESQKALARTNLDGALHDLGFFVDSFGHGETLKGWNGTGDMPDPDLSLVDTELTANYAALDSPRLQGFLWRLPWQLTASYNPSTGVYTPSTQADYNNDGRRMDPSKRGQMVEWVRRVARRLRTDWGVSIFHAGSELKGYQESGSKWGWAAFFDFFLALREGLDAAAADVEIDPDDFILIAPYPVVAHQGSITENAETTGFSGQNDAVNFDSRNDSEGNPVDYSLMNGDNATYGGWGYANKAPLEAIDEFLRLCQANDVDLPIFGVDFGTFNSGDNIPTPNITDHEHAYLRAKRHLQWYKQRLVARGYPHTKICLDEWYAKAQWQMQVPGVHFIDEELRDDYQASIKFAFLVGCLEEGLHLPMIWSPWGRGDQSTDANDQQDPNQWYGGMVKRTVTNNNSHSTSVVEDGGEAQAFLGVVKMLHDHFAEGTDLYAVTFSSPFWRGIASDTKVAVGNFSSQTRTLSIDGGDAVIFTPYQVQAIDRSGTDFSNSIVAYHKLDEASGNRLDSVGSATLTPVNTPGSAQGIRYPLAASLAIDSTQFFFAADSATLSGGNIDMWGAIRIVPDAVDVTSCIYGKWTTTGNNREWQLVQINDGITLQVSPDGTATANGAVSATGVLKAGEEATIMWYHDSVNDLLGLSINGAGFITASYAGGIFDSASAYTIGRQGQAGATYYGGLVQDALLGKGYIPTIQDADAFYNAKLPYGVASVQFLANGGEPDWSPDGKRIIFDRRHATTGFYQIFSINPDGTDEICLTDPAVTGGPAVNLHKGWPSFHPSGQYIVCQVEQTDNPQRALVEPGPEDLAEPGRGWWNNVWVCRADGSEWWQLTSYAAEDNNGVLVPRFSPDGTKLLWSKKIGGVDEETAPLAQWNLQIADFDIVEGVPTISNVTTLTPGDKTFYEAQGFNHDGTRIVFVGDPDSGNLYGYDIFSADLDGGNITNLTNTGTAWDEHAHYAKHDDYIAFMTSSLYPAYTAEAITGLRAELVVARADGTRQRRVTRFNMPGFTEYDSERNVATACAWNPSGTKLVAARQLMGASYDTIDARTLWIVNLKGTYNG